MKGLVFATGNQEKIDEAHAILGVPIEIANVEMDEVQSMDMEHVARKKTEAAYEILKRPVITDDVGVFIEAWNGFPGPFAKYILHSLGNEKILELLKDEENRAVVVKSAIGYHDGEQIHVFIGEAKGTLSKEQRGDRGWGFDPMIIPDGHNQTYAEMGPEGKNEVSHRRKAFDKLRDYLDSQDN